VRSSAIEAELVTPTGAALLTTLAAGWDAPPPYRLERVGTGAGSRELQAQPNVLRVLIGETGARISRRAVAVLETAVDDENPQVLADLAAKLLGEGALDVMVTPTVMKKGRAGLWMVALTEPADAERLAGRILAGSSSLGVRIRVDERIELPRRLEEIDTPFGRVTLKIAELIEGGERAMPEFESVRSAAEKSGRPIREVTEAAIAAWRSRSRG